MTSNMVRRFVELTKIPWVESQMGKGVIDARMRSSSKLGLMVWCSNMCTLPQQVGPTLAFSV